MAEVKKLADNDVLIKCAAYRLLERLDAAGPGAVGVLGAARYVVTSAIANHDRLVDRESAQTEWSSFLNETQELEPSPDEIELATELEELANELGLALDVGESQLCAMAVRRPGTLVLTGDKRCITAAESLRAVARDLTSLDGRVACLEQLLHAICAELGFGAVRTRVCAEPKADRALSVCFSCRSPEISDGDDAGLRSYIAKVRATAPSLLVESLASA